MNGFTYARQSLHLTIGFCPNDTEATSSPVIGSPYGLTITPIGTATSFYREIEFGMRSVVTLNTDLSELNSSKDDYCC